jgi:signal transduction histidine kinase/CheY-like chemotaxis protein
MAFDDPNLRVLIHAPLGRDAQLTAELLGRAGLASHICGSLGELCELVEEGAGVVLLTEEALSDRGVDQLAGVLADQPAWSDISVLLFAGDDRSQATLRTLRKLEVLRNVTLLDRPVRTAAVITTVQAALRGRRRQYELRDVLQALHAARVDAERANQLKDEFLATVSHELRTPLNAILGWVSMLRNARFEPPKVATILEIVERNAKAQAQLIADVLDISRMISGRVKLNVKRVSLARSVLEAVDSIRPTASAKGIALQVNVQEGPVIHADPDRLQQVIWNVLSNAAKFSHEGGRIDITVNADDTSASLVVCDTGIGIAPDFLPHVFDRFRQADQGFTRSAGGLGLGLAIVKHLVEMHGGHVTAESDGVGCGAKFTVQLPLARTSGLQPTAPVDEETGVEFPPVDLSGHLVLIVDDDETTRDLLHTMLQQAGARVKTAASVRMALAAFETEVPALVLADIGMPAEDGLSLIRRIRQRSALRGGLVRAIALSAFARAEDRDAALSAGFDDFLTKPAMPADIIKAVHRWLLSPPPGEAHALPAPPSPWSAEAVSAERRARPR